jgi:hypothetical protein
MRLNKAFYYLARSGAIWRDRYQKTFGHNANKETNFTGKLSCSSPAKKLTLLFSIS